MDERVAALLDREEIRRVVMDFARAVDRRDWDLLRSCFHADGRDDHGVFAGSVEEYVEWVRRQPAAIRRADDAPRRQRDRRPRGSGGGSLRVLRGRLPPLHPRGRDPRRLDRRRPLPRPFERRDGSWRIAERRLVWEWVRDDPVGAEFESFGIDPATLTWG
jgi:hypothetical protein